MSPWKGKLHKELSLRSPLHHGQLSAETVFWKALKGDNLYHVDIRTSPHRGNCECWTKENEYLSWQLRVSHMPSKVDKVLISSEEAATQFSYVAL